MKKIIFMMALLFATTGFLASAHAKYISNEVKELAQKRKIDFFVECGDYEIHFQGYVYYDGLTNLTHVTITIVYNPFHENLTIPVNYKGDVDIPGYSRKNNYQVKGKISADDEKLAQILMSRLYLPKSGNIKEVTFENFK